MGKAFQKIPKVAIYHPRRPYFIEAYQHRNAPDFAAIALTKGFWRILHTPTGLTMADTDARWVAEEFAWSIGRDINADPDLQEAFASLSWNGFMAYAMDGEDDPRVQLIVETIRRYTKREGYVDSKATKDCRYKRAPEYMK